MTVDLTGVETALNNIRTDSENGSALYQDPPGSVTLRNGDVVDNLRRRMEQIGYKVPVAFSSGLTASDGSFTVTHNGDLYAANPTNAPFTTTGTFNSGDWVLIGPGGALVLDGKRYQIVSCVLRQDSAGTGWYAIDDSGHAPVGLDAITPVSESDGKIVLNYGFSSDKIGTLVATSDEGYANGNLAYGASVGGSSALISLYHPFWCRASGTGMVAHSYFGPKASDATLSDGNWYSVHDTANGTWEVTHPSESHSDPTGSVVAVEKYGEDVSAREVAVTSRSKFGFTLQAQQAIHGRTNGNSTLLSEIVGASSVWNGVDTLTITHPASPAPNDAVVTSRDPLYNVSCVSDTTTVTIQFGSLATGALATGANIPANVQFLRGGLGPCALTGGTKFKAERLGRCRVKSEHVGGSSSNIWVSGLFEVT